MTIQPARRLSIFAAIVLLIVLSPAAPAADYSHARIVRLSQVQGEVKIARTDSSEAASGQNVNWEEAAVNLPIREGYVLATGNGRAVVEFENGAMVYLADNSVLQFTELALSDGARLTQLDLTQGTATFYANPAREDSFLVRSSSVEVKLSRKGRFRLDAYDDGSLVNVQQGEVDVTSGTETNSVTKGQSLSFRTDDQNGAAIARAPDSDDWDHWVSDHEDSILSATNYATTYVSSPDYSAGVGDLYTYGSWFSYEGYGQCWRPFGVGYGWSPFSNGRWVFYPGFGFTWVSFEPWGWMPYHFGGWVFSPVYGWLWVPGGFGFRNWRPATAVFVRGKGGLVGWVPIHPHDARGGTPANLARGVITRVGGSGAISSVPPDRAGKVEVVSAPPRSFASARIGSAAPPVRMSRTLVSDAGVSPGVRGSSGIVFDPHERKFVNANSSPSQPPSGVAGQQNSGPVQRDRAGTPFKTGASPGAPIMPGPAVLTNPSNAEPSAPAGVQPPASGAAHVPRTTSAVPRAPTPHSVPSQPEPIRTATPPPSAPPRPSVSVQPSAPSHAAPAGAGGGGIPHPSASPSAPSHPSAPSQPSPASGAGAPHSSPPPPPPAPRTESGGSARPHL